MKNIILLLFTFLSFSTFSQEKDAGYYYKIGDSLYFLEGDEYDGRLSLEFLNEAIRLDSSNVDYFLRRAKVLRYEDFLKQSNRDLNKIIQLKPADSILAQAYDLLTIYNNPLAGELENYVLINGSVQYPGRYVIKNKKR